MTFTEVTVTHEFDLANQVAAVGVLYFTPVDAMHNEWQTVPAAPIRAPLETTGLLSQVLSANTDPDTWPVGVRYRVDERITGQPPRHYFITVPHDQGPAVDLYQLIEQAKVTNGGVYPQVPVDMTAVDGIVTPDAGRGEGPFRYTAGFDFTLADPINGRDGQQITLQITASGADREMSFDGDGVDPVTITQGTVYVATLQLIDDDGTWLLEDNQTSDAGGVTDHGALTGLGDDDHSQYHTDARGDARYSLIGHTHPQADVTGLTAALAAKQDRSLTSSTRTGSYSIVALDAGVEQIYNSTSAGTFTLPTNASQAIPVGEAIPLRQSNTGQLTVAAAGGVTLNARGGATKLAGQYAVAEARKVATDTWVLYGDITT